MYCRSCGYPLRNLDGNRCPECGLIFDRDDPRSYDTGRRNAYPRWVSIVGMIVGIAMFLISIIKAIDQSNAVDAVTFLLVSPMFAALAYASFLEHRAATHP